LCFLLATFVGDILALVVLLWQMYIRCARIVLQGDLFRNICATCSVMVISHFMFWFTLQVYLKCFILFVFFSSASIGGCKLEQIKTLQVRHIHSPLEMPTIECTTFKSYIKRPKSTERARINDVVGWLLRALSGFDKAYGRRSMDFGICTRYLILRLASWFSEPLYFVYNLVLGKEICCGTSYRSLNSEFCWDLMDVNYLWRSLYIY